MYSIEQAFMMGSILLFISVLTSKISARLGIPALLFFLIVGMLANKWEVSIMSFLQDQNVAQNIGIITLIIVLFLGGLETDFNHVKPILRSGFILSTLGVLITTCVIGIFSYWLTGGYLSLIECFILGTIISSTDAAAVFSILGARDIQLKAHLSPLLEFESGSNDVISYSLLIFLVKETALSHTSLYTMVPYFLQEMLLGGLGGIVLGYMMVFVINKIKLSYPGLYLALVISILFFSYGLINSLHGSGFLTVYMSAIVLGQKGFINRKSITETLKGVSWLMQIIMFVSFGLLVIPEKLINIAPWGISLALFLMLVARPLAVFISLPYSSFTFLHKLFISAVGLRGAVPIIFATYLTSYGLSQTKVDTIFHLVFFIVLVSISLQGTMLYRLVKWLGLEDKSAQKKQKILAMSDDAKKMLIQLSIPLGSHVNNKPIVEIDFPQNARIALIHRGKNYLRAHGKTVIKANDTLLIMMDAKKDLKAIKTSLGI